MRLCAPIQVSLPKSGSDRMRAGDHKFVIWRGMRNHGLGREDSRHTEGQYLVKLGTRYSHSVARRFCVDTCNILPFRATLDFGPLDKPQNIIQYKIKLMELSDGRLAANFL
jgi:hypothetical protein